MRTKNWMISPEKETEKKIDAEQAPVVEKVEAKPKTKEELRKEAISTGKNVASNADAPSDIGGDKFIKAEQAAKDDNRATLPVCTGRNGHPGVDCRPLPPCSGAKEEKLGETCRNPGPPSTQPPSRSIGNPTGIPEQPLPAAVPDENVENKDGAGVLSVDPAIVETSKAEAKAAANKTETAKTTKKVDAAEPAKEVKATASF